MIDANTLWVTLNINTFITNIFPFFALINIIFLFFKKIARMSLLYRISPVMAIKFNIRYIDRYL